MWRIRNGVPANKIRRTIRGSNNHIEYRRSSLQNVRFDICGNNNRIHIADDCVLNNVIFSIRGDNHRRDIANGCKFNQGGHLWIEDNDCALNIGRASTFENVHIAVTEPGSRIDIGEDCMFAYDIDVRTGDSHAIISESTGKKINHAKDIRIGNHVWVAAHCILLKAVDIADNCVVATGPVVTRSCETQGTVMGGNPAQALKDGITWSRNRFPEQP